MVIAADVTLSGTNRYIHLVSGVETRLMTATTIRIAAHSAPHVQSKIHMRMHNDLPTLRRIDNKNNKAKPAPTALPSWPDTMATNHMTDAELRLYRKRTAYMFDIAFVATVRPELRAQLEALPHTRAGSKLAFQLARITPLQQRGHI